MHWYRGMANLRFGDSKQARLDFEKAYRQHPNHVGALWELAEAYRREGRFKEAGIIRHRALANLSRFVEVKVNLADFVNSNARPTQIPKAYASENLNAYGINITFGEPVEKGRIVISTEGGDDLGWRAEWAETSVWLRPLHAKTLDDGTAYLIIIKARAGADALFDVRLSFVTEGKGVGSGVDLSPGPSPTRFRGGQAMENTR